MHGTPILDRIQPAPARGQYRWWALLTGAAAGILVVRWAPSFDSGWLLRHPLGFGLTLLGVYYLAILLHESGHLAAGLCAGFSFRQFAVGPLVLNQESRGLRLQFSGDRFLAGGQVTMAPDTTGHLRLRFFQFFAGGPAVTLLLFALPLAFPRAVFANCLLIVNFLIAANSLLPFSINGRCTDGRLLLGLIRPGPAAERLAAILYLLVLDSRGVTPRDWPADSIRILERETGDPTYREIARMFAYFCALDGGEPEPIANALERILELADRIHPDSRRAWFAEAAFVQGIYRKDAPLARAWLEDARHVEGVIEKPDWESAALAGIACAEGNAAGTAAQLARAIAMLDRQPGTSGSLLACRSRLAALLAAAQGPVQDRS
jgi:hypothetical protein